MKSSYLITGGLGFIGSSLANAIEGAVTIVSRSDEHRDRIKRKDAKFIIKNISKLEKSDIDNIDVIYHCASTVHNYHVLTDPYLDIDINLNGAVRLLELCKDLPKRPKIIYLSTFFVYGNEYSRTKKVITEESKTEPLGIYPATMLCAESIIKLYSRIYDIPYIICRLANVYGEREGFGDSKKGVLNFLIMKAVKGENINLYNGGNFYRDYIHVDDVVSALRFLERKTSNDLFLIGYGKPVKFKDMLDYILEQTGKRSRIIDIEPPPFHKAVGITNFVADTSKINSLGWRAAIDYRIGLQRVIEFCKSL